MELNFVQMEVGEEIEGIKEGQKVLAHSILEMIEIQEEHEKILSDILIDTIAVQKEIITDIVKLHRKVTILACMFLGLCGAVILEMILTL